MTIAIEKAPHIITVAGLGLPHSRAEIEAMHAPDREALATYAKGVTVTDEASLLAARAILSDVAQSRDGYVKMRQGPVAQIKGVIKEWESWFLAPIKEHDAAEAGVKASCNAYLTAKANEAAKAREAAQVAADRGDSSAVLANIQQAQALEAVPSGTRYAWEVKRIATDLLPDEYWIPDHEKIAAVAKAAGSGEEPPVIPGVVFERVATMQARRK